MSFISTGISTGGSSLGYKASVRAASTADIPSLSGLLTLDTTVTLVAGDRVLVKDQTAGEDNGIYVAAAGAWVRSDDLNESIEARPGMIIVVQEGTLNQDKIFILTTDAPITLGVTPLTFATTTVVSDHGLLSGLSDDDHTQYVKVVGRTNEDQELAGDLKFSSSNTRQIGKHAAATLVLQDLTFTADGTYRAFLGNALSIEYTSGATPGAEVVNVVGDAISIQIATTVAAVKAALTVDELTFTADTAGAAGNSIQIEYLDTATAGSEVSTTVGNLISVAIQSGVSTSNQVKSALLADVDAMALIDVTGSGTNAQSAMSAANLTGGADAIPGSTATQISDAIALAGLTQIAVAISGTGSNVQTPVAPTLLSGGDLGTFVPASVSATEIFSSILGVRRVVDEEGLDVLLAGGPRSLHGSDGVSVFDFSSAAATNTFVIGKVLTGFSAGVGTVSSSDSILSAFNKTTANLAAVKSTADAALPAASFTDSAVTGKLITGFTSGAGSVSAGDSILQALNKIDGNVAATVSVANAALPATSFSDAGVTGKLLTGFSSGAGTVSASDSILSAFNKINGNVTATTSVANAALPSASFTDTAVTGKLLTGFVSGSGTVAATDSILQAVNKLNGNDALKLPLAGGTLSGAITIPAGAVSTPSINITGSLTTGLYSSAANTLNVAVNGVEFARMVGRDFRLPFSSGTRPGITIENNYGNMVLSAFSGGGSINLCQAGFESDSVGNLKINLSTSLSACGIIASTDDVMDFGRAIQTDFSTHYVRFRNAYLSRRLSVGADTSVDNTSSSCLFIKSPADFVVGNVTFTGPSTTLTLTDGGNGAKGVAVALGVGDYVYATGLSGTVARVTGRTSALVYTLDTAIGDGTPRTLTVRQNLISVKDRSSNEQFQIDPDGAATFAKSVKVNGLKVAVRAVTGTDTATVNDDVITCSGTFTLNLPAATGSGKKFAIKNIGTGTITIDGNASETIDGATTLVLTAQYDAVHIVDCASGVWYVV